MGNSQYIFIGIVGIFFMAISTIPIQSRLIWNRTQSAPLGLYWLTKQSPIVGEWALISDKSDEAIWAQNQGYTGPKWPILKRVSATQDDIICRADGQIIVNKSHIATVPSYPQNLPEWEGCFKLDYDEAFLLNPHPHSLDGRYFGLTNIKDIEGKLIPIWTYTP